MVFAEDNQQCNYLLLLLPIIINRGPSDVTKKGLTSKIDSVNQFVQLLAESEEISRVFFQRREQLQHLSISHLSNATQEELDIAKTNAVRALKPFIEAPGSSYKSL